MNNYYSKSSYTSYTWNEIQQFSRHVYQCYIDSLGQTNEASKQHKNYSIYLSERILFYKLNQKRRSELYLKKSIPKEDRWKFGPYYVAHPEAKIRIESLTIGELKDQLKRSGIPQSRWSQWTNRHKQI